MNTLPIFAEAVTWPEAIAFPLTIAAIALLVWALNKL